MSPKVIKALVSIGLVLAFLAVPVGSYFIVGHYKSEFVKMQSQRDAAISQVKAYKALVEFTEEQKKLVAVQEATRTIEILKYDDIDRILETEIDSSEKSESSEVLKKTVRILKENAQ